MTDKLLDTFCGLTVAEIKRLKDERDELLVMLKLVVSVLPQFEYPDTASRARELIERIES